MIPNNIESQNKGEELDLPTEYTSQLEVENVNGSNGTGWKIKTGYNPRGYAIGRRSLVTIDDLIKQKIRVYGIAIFDGYHKRTSLPEPE